MSSKIARKDFEIYAKGVKRLEELEKEINILGVDKKFPTEAASIRSKLKHVSEIPQIEYELKMLKDKISGKAKKKVKTKSITDSRIKSLKEEIKRKSQQCKKFAPLSKEVLKLKLEIEHMHKKIAEYEEEKKRKNKLLENINVGVEKVFDDTMNLSLAEIKAKLSKQIENKEADVQKELQLDLKRREELFDDKYNQLEKQFHDNYNDRVKQELKKEVNDKLDEKVNAQVNKKVKSSEAEVNALKRRLVLEHASKERILQEHFDKAIAEEKKRQKEDFQERLLAQKIKLHKKLDSEIAKEVLEIKQKEAEKQHELNQKLSGVSKLKEKLMNVFRAKKERLEAEDEKFRTKEMAELERVREEEMNKIKQKQRGIEAEKLKIDSLKNKMLSSAKNQIQEEKEELEAEKRRAEEAIARREEAIKKKAEAIRANLQKEYDEKLREAIKLKEQEFKKKNLDLEKEIKKKVQMFYK